MRGENAGNTFLDGSDLAYLQLLCDSFARHIFNNSPLSLLSCSRSSTSHRAFLTHTQTTPHAPDTSTEKTRLGRFLFKRTACSYYPPLSASHVAITLTSSVRVFTNAITLCFSFSLVLPAPPSPASLSLSWDARCLCLPPRLRRTLPVSHAPVARVSQLIKNVHLSLKI